MSLSQVDQPIQKSKDKLVRQRPALFQALGKKEPPEQVVIGGFPFRRRQIFKHDSWAATALYDGPRGSVVCKFNRTKSCLGVPMQWLGRWLARREAKFFRMLQNVPGIPRGWDTIVVDDRVVATAFAHDFVPGQPLSLVHDTDEQFFDELSGLLNTIHTHHMAYVDLNKPENVLVGEDGHPYLFDFQISIRLPDLPGLRWPMKLLQQSDRYHLLKHRVWRLNRERFEHEMEARRPWWIRWHRSIGVPLRTFRRRLLVLLGIRKGRGGAHTELAPEHGLCTAEKIVSAKKAA